MRDMRVQDLPKGSSVTLTPGGVASLGRGRLTAYLWGVGTGVGVCLLISSGGSGSQPKDSTPTHAPTSIHSTASQRH
jgi:hypothetical protein